MKKKLLACLFCGLLAANFCQAEEAIPAKLNAADAAEIVAEEQTVETVSRVETPATEVGSTVTVITADEIKSKHQLVVSDVLRSVAGLHVSRAGGRGQPESVYLRGCTADQTVVLIDGVEITNVMSPGRSAMVSDILLETVERIEVLRGPQSVMYGSDAIGGVINIITKKGKGKVGATFTGEAGTIGELHGGLQVYGGTEKANFYVNLSRTYSAGLSAAREIYNNSEEDDYLNTAFSGRLDFAPCDNIDFGFFFGHTDAKTDVDDAGYKGGDDPNRTVDTTQIFARGQVTLKLFHDCWKQTLGVSITDVDRTELDRPDKYDLVDTYRGDWNGNLVKIDWVNEVVTHQNNTVVFGLENEREKGDGSDTNLTFNGESRRTGARFIEDRFSLFDSLFLSAGYRQDDVEDLTQMDTWRFAATYYYKDTGTRFLTSYGKAFKAPSLYQLTASTTGNKGLEPEVSHGWDLGFEQALFDSTIKFGLTYYNNDTREMIALDPTTNRYANLYRVNLSGFESFIELQLLHNLKLRWRYTYNRSEDHEDGRQMLLRPKHIVAFDADWTRNKWMINLNSQYVDCREDFATGIGMVELDSYLLVNLAATYKFNEHLEFYGRVENLLDRDYEEVFGYASPSINAYLGLSLSF
jgi:vitamin B12 transporter